MYPLLKSRNRNDIHAWSCITCRSTPRESKYYRQSVLRDTQLTSDSRSCILQFEKESVAHDSLQKKETQSEFVV